jgi:hypothetical protein
MRKDCFCGNPVDLLCFSFCVSIRYSVFFIDKLIHNSTESNYRGFQTHLTAFVSQAKMQGVLLFSGLQEAQVYFIFFLCSSLIAATVLSSRSMNSVSSLSAV